MKLKSILRILSICIITVVFTQCTSPTKSKTTPTKVTIKDVWITDTVDGDGDGYYSYLRFNFDLDVNKQDSVSVFVRLGRRVTDPLDTALYDLYFTSADFKIAGESESDAKYISIGFPNNEFSQASYDLLFEVYFSINPDNRIAVVGKSEYPDIGGVLLESYQEDVINTWLSYNDGSFENGYFWNNTTGYFAVQFDKPSGAMDCMIKAIRFHNYANSANVYIQVWDYSAGFPGNYIYNSSAGNEFYLYSNQWNTAYLDIDVTNYDQFFVGYYQYQQAMPVISVDETTPLYGRSYYKSISATSWTNDSNGDYAIEVYIEYTISSTGGKPVVKHEWLSSESN